jgi:hypothetical protein
VSMVWMSYAGCRIGLTRRSIVRALRRPMKRYWMFVYWMYLRDADRLVNHCTVSRLSEPSGEGPIAGRFVRDGLLAARLTLTLETFDRDCFYWGDFIFVSERMRNAKALRPSDIQYFDVNVSESAPLPRSKNYQIMHVPVTEDVSDPINSDYICRHLPDGSVVQTGMPLVAVFRQDAKPAHGIFYDKLFRVIYCTDEFALRVLKVGCPGAYFVDPSHPFGNVTRLRTLRGVEEIVRWNKGIFRTKLVETIP